MTTPTDREAIRALADLKAALDIHFRSKDLTIYEQQLEVDLKCAADRVGAALLSDLERVEGGACFTQVEKFTAMEDRAMVAEAEDARLREAVVGLNRALDDMWNAPHKHEMPRRSIHEKVIAHWQRQSFEALSAKQEDGNG